ncbi:MAG TPA: sortase [Ruminococcaceae bacterium]|jgi:sortase A|nr:sortase [Oscillospiraceae bacterium]HCC01823.1 sortase [Oscillospiraceae bacterium]HCM24699.1 sortase [Oscillospiraceae bacterium]
MVHRSKKGTIFMALGTILVLSALILVLYNRWDDQRAGKAAADVVTQIEKQLPNQQVSFVGQTAQTDNGKTSEFSVNGHSYIGIVKIPSLHLTLPVLNKWSYPLLRIAPCRYQGSLQKGTLIIAGHNYQRHFGLLHCLSIGDSVTFTDVNGNVYRYRVSGMETIPKQDVKQMESGDWDLTLFTCTLDGQRRVTIRCKQIP